MGEPHPTQQRDQVAIQVTAIIPQGGGFEFFADIVPVPNLAGFADRDRGRCRGMGTLGQFALYLGQSLIGLPFELEGLEPSLALRSA